MAKSKNSGFTLLELLILIVITGIAAGFMYLSVANVGSSAAREAANDMDYLLSRCRSAGLSRAGESYIELRATADGSVADYYETGTMVDSLDLGGKRVACAVDEAELSGTVKIGFQRVTGAEKSGDGYTAVRNIVFSGGSADYSLYIVPATGSHGLS